jgi:hypothetical protein
MKLFYTTLETHGWTNPVSQPDEWVSEDGQFEINISHSGSLCYIRYRKLVHRNDQESTDVYYSRRKAVPWNTQSRSVIEGTGTDFSRWLGRAYQTIETYCTGNRVVAKAPGE